MFWFRGVCSRKEGCGGGVFRKRFYRKEGILLAAGFNSLWAPDSLLLAPIPGTDSQEFATARRL